MLPGQPVITGLIKTNGNAGTPITLTGINFGTSTGTVTINGVVAPLKPQTIWTPTSVAVSIPASAASGLVILSTSSGLTSNGVPIKLTEAVSCPVQ
jgi:hypothetical protein